MTISWSVFCSVLLNNDKQLMTKQTDRTTNRQKYKQTNNTHTKLQTDKQHTHKTTTNIQNPHKNYEQLKTRQNS